MMSMASQQTIQRAGARLAQAAGLTLAEVSVAFGIATLIGAGFMSFIVLSARMVDGITKQGSMNEQAGDKTEILRQRVHAANSLAVDSKGEVLTLTFDDNPNVDSDGDGNYYDDVDHTEVFQFRYPTKPGKAQAASLGTNFIDWVEGNGSTDTLFSTVRKLPNLNVFALTNNAATVIINFGLLTYANNRTRNIEIRTLATERNHR